MDFTLEIIGFNIENCIKAQIAGANRIELCDNPGDGGTTPSYGFIKKAREVLQIGLYSMIRPRGGDFFYSNEEFDIMKTDVLTCKQLGCDGVVIGMLNRDGTVDKERSKKLVELAYPMGVTYQRAFDRVKDPFAALEDVIETGCERILTSGLVPSCLDGAPLIAQLIRQADERIIIMPGSMLRSNNVAQIAKITGAVEFHTSARINTGTQMGYTNDGMKESLQSVSVDEEEIKKIIINLKNITA
ncbi:MAG TPA: copper homeostasis protein CutC [Ferruginibacter sp.]|jgi:copper homeostasis protein|nr:copper homeostasis protein CutC [Ferruginibacter sp.]